MSASLRAKSMAAAVLGVVGLSVAVGRHRPPTPLVPLETRALAQAPDDTKIHIDEAAPLDAGAPDAFWHRFQVTLPPHAPMLDMHIGLLVDNAGSELVQERATALPQSFPLKFKLDADDDTRVKAIMKAQGLPVKDSIVTYGFISTYPGGENSSYQTITFDDALGVGGAEAHTNTPIAAIGTKMVLLDEVVGDSSIHSYAFHGLGHIGRIASLDALPPGRAHRFTVYVLFTPHQGPLRDEGRTESITRG